MTENCWHDGKFRGFSYLASCSHSSLLLLMLPITLYMSTDALGAARAQGLSCGSVPGSAEESGCCQVCSSSLAPGVMDSWGRRQTGWGWLAAAVLKGSSASNCLYFRQINKKARQVGEGSQLSCRSRANQPYSYSWSAENPLLRRRKPHISFLKCPPEKLFKTYPSSGRISAPSPEPGSWLVSSRLLLPHQSPSSPGSPVSLGATTQLLVLPGPPTTSLYPRWHGAGSRAGGGRRAPACGVASSTLTLQYIFAITDPHI